jgi:hypothetical protein
MALIAAAIALSRIAARVRDPAGFRGLRRPPGEAPMAEQAAAEFLPQRTQRAQRNFNGKAFGKDFSS